MRGRYRILLGMAAGVGKTYRMLQEGRQAQAEGRDVVIGYLEPHDRPETAALAEGLEVVPRLRPARRPRARGDGRRRGDPPRARARADRRARAHEPPGTRNEKRYQDIDEVLDAGIDVISTVNVQHLESLNDAIAELTGRPRARDVPRPDPRRGRRGRARRPHARGAAGAAARGQGLPARAGRGGARQLLPRRQALARCASWRCARWPRTSRRGGRRPCSIRSASRRSPSGCSRSSTPRAAVAADPAPRVALGRAARRAARRALGAPPGPRADRRRSRCSSPRCGGSRSSSARTSSRRRATTSSRPCARVVARARLDVRLRRHARREPAARDPPRLARLGARPRAAGDRHPRRREPRRPRGAGRVMRLSSAARRRLSRAAPTSRQGARHPRAVRGRARPDACSTRRSASRAPRRRCSSPAYLLIVPLQYAGGLAAARTGRGRAAAARGGRARGAAGAASRSTRGSRRAGRTHALRRLWEVERFDRIVAPAGGLHGEGARLAAHARAGRDGRPPAGTRGHRRLTR